MSRSDDLNLAVSFKARRRKSINRVSRQRHLKIAVVIQPSLTRRERLSYIYRALKHTAKFRQSLSDIKGFSDLFFKEHLLFSKLNEQF